MSEWIARAVARYPVRVLLVCLLGVLVLSAGMKDLELDRSMDALILPGDPDRAFLDAMKERFGSDEIIVVALVGDDVFAPGTLRKVKALSTTFAAIPGVSEVKSLATANRIEAASDGVRIGKLFRDVPSDPAALAEIRRKALSDPLFRGNLVSADGRAAALIVYLTPAAEHDPKKQYAAVEAVDAAAHAVAGPERVYASGVPHNKVANSQLSRRELRILLPILLVANALLVCALYRSLRGLVLPVLGIVLGLTSTLGIMGWLGYKINAFGVAIPFFAIILGAAYTVHAMTGYYQSVGAHALRRGSPVESRARQIEEYVREFLGPFQLIIATTAIGFLSLVTNQIPAAWQLGVATGLGCLVMFPICGVLLPAALRLLDAPARLPPPPREGRLQWLWILFARLGSERPRLMIGLWTAGLLVAALGASRIQLTSNTLEFLEPDHPLRVSEREIGAHLGATWVLSVYVDAGGEGEAAAPENLERLARLQAYARTLPETDSTLSLIDYLEPLKAALAAEPPAPGPTGRVLPATREEAAELLLIYSEPADLARYVDADRGRLRLVIRSNKRGSAELTSVATRMEAEARRLGFPPGRAHATSTLLLLGHSFDDVAWQMGVSIFTGVVFIFPALVLLTRSLRTATIAMIPNTVPSIFVFGFMGFMGYKLDLASSLIASITLGIAVDDTIHFLAKFRRLRDEGTTVARALELGLREAGPAMVFATGMLSVSLLLFNASVWMPTRHMGQLAAFGFATCLLADLTLHPALLAVFAPRAPAEGRPVPAESPAEAVAAAGRG